MVDAVHLRERVVVVESEVTAVVKVHLRQYGAITRSPAAIQLRAIWLDIDLKSTA